MVHSISCKFCTEESFPQLINSHREELAISYQHITVYSTDFPWCISSLQLKLALLCCGKLQHYPIAHRRQGQFPCWHELAFSDDVEDTCTALMLHHHSELMIEGEWLFECHTVFGLNHFLELSYLVNTGSVLQFSQFYLCHPLVAIS